MLLNGPFIPIRITTVSESIFNKKRINVTQKRILLLMVSFNNLSSIDKVM